MNIQIGWLEEHFSGCINSQKCDCKILRGYILVFFIGVAIVGLQFAGYLLSNSLALLGDTLHVGTDSLSHIVAILAILYARYRPLKKQLLERWGGSINGTLLLIASVWLLMEAWNRNFNPREIEGVSVTIIASLGACGNFFQLYILEKSKYEQKGSLIYASIIAHVLSDLLQSISVVASGVLSEVSSSERAYFIDPFISIMIGGTMTFYALRLIIQSAGNQQHHHHH